MLKKIMIFIVLWGTILQATVPTEENVAKLYVATFNRAPDTAGLNYWVNDSKLSLEQIAQSFFDQTETQEAYPSDVNITVFVETVYANLFNRNPDQAGWDYWVQELDSGSIAKSVFILAVINGALNNDATILENKSSVGLAFANAGLNDVEEAKNIMRGITDDLDTVSAALNTLLAEDILSPVITVPGNIILTATGESGVDSTSAAIIAFLEAASATDNIAVVGSVTNDAPTVFPVGTTTVTFSAVDSEGNIGTATATVTVNIHEDTINPILTVPENIIIMATSADGIESSVAKIVAFLTGASASDNVAIDGEISHNAPIVFPIGETTVTFTVSDTSGNSVSAVSTVTITEPEDINETGACVMLPRLGTGDVFTIRAQNLIQSTTVDVETTIVSFGETLATYATESTGDLVASGEKTETYTIGNNYIDITKIISSDVTTVSGYTVATDTTLVFTPQLRVPIDEVCEGTVLESAYELETAVTTPGFSIPTNVSNHVSLTTIESVNMIKTTTLGTFTTVQMKMEDGESKTISWIDILTGYFVASEYYNADGVKEGTQELISHN